MHPSTSVLVAILIPAVSGIAQDTIYRFKGSSPGEALYRSAGPLTLDADGVFDMVIARQGEVMAVSGQTGTVLYSFPFSTAGSTTNVGGHCVLGAIGDLNGDGLDEFIVGVPGDATNSQRSGRATVHSGADGSVLYSYLGAADTNNDGSGDTLGYSVGGLGDVDNDGMPDFFYAAIGDSWDEANPGPCIFIDDAGYLDVLSGATGNLLYRHWGSPGCDKIRVAVPIDDVNMDGYQDYGIGNGQSSGDTGWFSVRSGLDHSQIRIHNGSQLAEYFGVNAAGVGDVDNDGTRDYAVCAPNPWCYSCSALDPGIVRVYSGSNGALLHNLAGASIGDFFGGSVCDVGDFNGDGYDDFAIGASADDTTFTNAGRVQIFSGANASVLWSLSGESVDHRLGAWNGVNYLGDINFDGAPELAIAAFNLGGTSGRHGEVRVVSTEPKALTQENHLISIAGGGQTGFSLDAGSAGAGDIYLVLGSATGFTPGTTTPNSIPIPLNPDFYFGATISPATSPVIGGMGLLDANGLGSAQLIVPAGVVPPVLQGFSFYHAFVTFDVTLSDFEFASNHVVLTLTN